MKKKVKFNGIEILTSEDDRSAKDLLGFVETILNNLKSEIDDTDDNFHIYLSTEFAPPKRPRHTISTIGPINDTTVEKVLRILRQAALNDIRAKGTVKINLFLEDD